jgi:diacylglycerol kinase (ATP)
MSIQLFWNKHSGKATQLAELRTALQDHPVRWTDLTEQADLPRAILAGVDSGVRTVVAAGGDGTVNLLVNALMRIDPERRPRLAVVPLGTANDFAGTLQVSDEVTAAAELLTGGHTVAVDIVHLAGPGCDHYFANVAAGGNCVRVSEEMTDEIKSTWGPFSYLRGAVDVLSDMRSFRVTAETDTERFEDLDTWAVLVANGKTNAGRIEVAPRASVTDGLLDVILIRNGGPLDVVSIVAHNLTHRFLESEQIIFRQSKRLLIESEPPMRFTVDGEVVEEEPTEFEILPGAIEMFVGHQFEQRPQAAGVL